MKRVGGMMHDISEKIFQISGKPKNMKVLLVSFFNDEAYGLRSLHATLVENKIDAQMLFFKVESKQFRANHIENTKKDFTGSIRNASDKEIELLYDFIISNGFNVVGFSLVSSNFRLYKRIYQKIKNINNLTIVLGGWQASLNPDECIRYTDYLCIGEGEIALNELITSLANNRVSDHVLNFWINKNGTVIKNPVRPLTENISSFPIPLYEHQYSYYIENDELVSYELYYDNVRYGTFIGRGCPKQCTYCSNSFMANVIYPKSWSKIRYRTIEHVKNELTSVRNKLRNIKSDALANSLFSVFVPL